MKNQYSYLFAIVGSCILAGCGSSSTTDGNNTTGISKSNLQLEIIATAPSLQPPAGIELKVDYDQSVAHPSPDINQNAAGSVSLNGVLARKDTYMIAYDNGDILTLNLLNARGFDNGEKIIGIDFDVLKGEPAINSYQIIPGTLKIFDLNGEEISNFEVVRSVYNQ